MIKQVSSHSDFPKSVGNISVGNIGSEVRFSFVIPFPFLSVETFCCCCFSIFTS